MFKREKDKYKNDPNTFPSQKIENSREMDQNTGLDSPKRINYSTV